MKKRLLALLLLSTLLLATACKKEAVALPQGMDETQLLEQGREIVALLNEDNWQGVYERMREDAQQVSSAEDIQLYMEKLIERVGAYKQEDDTLLTPQTLDSGEEYVSTVIYAKHEKKSVIYRIAFSLEMELMGLEAKKQGLF